MKIRPLLFCSVIFVMFFSSYTQADPERYVLTVRQLPNDEYEAVVSYNDDWYCFLAVTPASSVEINGFEIIIKSPLSDQPIYCLGPVPPINYFEETAYIGDLAPGNYTVTWDQPEAFSLSTSFEVDGYSPIPSSSLWSLLLLGLGVLVVANSTLRHRRSTAPK